MKWFVMELSTRMGSMALLEEGAIVREEQWEEDFRNRQKLFDAMTSMQIDWEAVDGFAVGRGPGAFSGLRIGFSVVNALAAPGGKPCFALNSAAAIAVQTEAPQTVVIGDARRERIWAGLFSGGRLERDFELLEQADLATYVPEGAEVVSPDYERLETLLADLPSARHKAPLYPTAGRLGTLLQERLQAGEEPEPFEPLYMHPPVFVEPRFPA